MMALTEAQAWVSLGLLPFPFPLLRAALTEYKAQKTVALTLQGGHSH